MKKKWRLSLTDAAPLTVRQYSFSFIPFIIFKATVAVTITAPSATATSHNEFSFNALVLLSPWSDTCSFSCSSHSFYGRSFARNIQTSEI